MGRNRIGSTVTITTDVDDSDDHVAGTFRTVIESSPLCSDARIVVLGGGTRLLDDPGGVPVRLHGPRPALRNRLADKTGPRQQP